MLDVQANNINKDMILLVQQWFYNVQSGKTNDCILILEYRENENFDVQIRQIFKKNGLENLQYSVSNATNIDHSIVSKPSNNLIIAIPFFTNILNLLNHSKLQGKSFLYVPRGEATDFYSKMEQHILTEDTVQISDIPINKRYYYYIEKIDPLELIQTRTTEEISNFLRFMIEQRRQLWMQYISSPNLHFLSVLLEGTVFNKVTFQIGSLFDNLNNDIQMLKKGNILTSRLATIIYRVALLDAAATTVKAGKYFHEKTGSKSKMFKKNHSKIKLLHIELASKDFKAYDLTVDEKALSIRKEIATKLLQLKISELDMQTIAVVTNLSEQEINKLMKNS